LEDVAATVTRQAQFYEAPGDFRSGVHAACDALLEWFDDLTADAVTARVGVIYHELGTPLAVIAGALETLSDRGSELTEEQHDAIVRAAKRHMGHLTYLLDRLLITDEEHGGFPVSVERVELDELAYRIVDDLAPATRDRAVHVKVHNGDTPPVSADPHAVRRILAALLSNAVKYSPPDTPIVISIESTDHVVELRVTDEGRGIPTAEHETIFTKGGRLGNGEVPGSGLGLYLARGLAQAQGGSLEVGARVDGRSGTTFSLRLPQTDG
jgi:two-component system sensor histidine kinase KdpD